MKAVLLAGGLGTRMREETEFRPKPMVEVGGRPVLWHIMKVLGTQGITDFVICAGYKSEYIKNYFYNYGAANLDFTVRLGDQSSTVFHGSHEEFDWTVTVADTGESTMTGGRIKMIEKYVEGETFLATYGDGIADIDLSALSSFHQSHGKTATMTVTQPTSRFGVVDISDSGLVSKFREKPKVNDWINMGYFVFNPGVFNYLEFDSVLEENPLRELATQAQLGAYKHSGFWQPMDTYREFLELNALWDAGRADWKIW
jgi:glucose-1-phosphate cytidylyltransferase